MANAYAGIPVPGYEKGAEYTDPEILYSTVGWTQKGVTLAGGQGVLAAGTVLARNDADKKYYAYDNASATAGIGVARGVLRQARDLGPAGSPDQLGNMVITGILKLNMVTGSDAGALTDLGATIDTVRGTFKF